MKVLHLTTHLNTGGITTYIKGLVKPFLEHGVESQILSSGGSVSEEFKKLGATVHSLDIRTKSELSPKLYLALSQLKKIIRTEQIDVLHAHTRVTQVMAFWVSRELGIPVVTTCHGFFDRRLGRKLLPGWGDRVVAISKPVQEQLREMFHVPQSKIALIENGVDIDWIDEQITTTHRAEVRQKYGFSAQDFVFGVISRISEDKGLGHLVRALHQLSKEFHQIKLLIVGEGKDLPQLKRLTEELGLQSRVVFAGICDNIAEPLTAIDVFAFVPYYREGFGLNVAEAMAFKKPVIASRLGGITSLVEHEVNGLLVEPDHHDSLCASFKRLIQDQELCERLAQEARETISQQFTTKRMASDLINLYRRLLKENQPEYENVST